MGCDQIVSLKQILIGYKLLKETQECYREIAFLGYHLLGLFTMIIMPSPIKISGHNPDANLNNLSCHT